MNIDDAVRQVFESDVLDIPGRTPEPDEIARALLACSDRRRTPLRRAFHDVLPAAVLAAACFAVVVSGQPGGGFARPLAVELLRTLPEDSGDHFVTFIVSAGDSFRSVNR